MSEHDVEGDALERPDSGGQRADSGGQRADSGGQRADSGQQRADPPRERLTAITRRTALSGGAAGLAAVLLEACGGSSGPAPTSTTTATNASDSNRTPAQAVFGGAATYRFTMVNHATNSSFFTATQYGAADACRLFGCSYHWTGSETSNIPQMLTAINTAVSEKVNGIATTLIDPTAFNTAVEDALAADIPVVAYNADATDNPRLAYIGQDLFASGQTLGQQILELLPHGGDVAVFAATPGQTNLQPRIEGVRSVIKHHRGLKHRVVSTGSTAAEQVRTIEAYINAHPTFHGFFAVDGGSTAAVGQAIAKYGLKSRGVVGGGYGINDVTAKLIAQGQLAFTIAQQAYMQGFLPILELYLYNVSDKLTGIADVTTGLKVIDLSTLAPYSTTTSRFEGTSSSPGVQKTSS